MSIYKLNLAVFLAIGESFADFDRKGQTRLLVDYLFKNYSKHFDKVYVFSYSNEDFSVGNNIQVLPNKWRLHRYLYCWLIPILYRHILIRCGVARCLQISGGFPGMVNKYLFKRPFVVNYGYDYVKMAAVEKKQLQAWFYKILIPFILKSADRVIVTTKNLGKAIEPLVNSDRIVHIPNGVDTKLFKPVKVVKSRQILFVGRLEVQKNLPLLIKAMSRIKTKNRLILKFVGQGSATESLKQFAKAKGVHLEIVSPLSHSKLPKVYNQALLFVLPSLIEGQPKVLLEAMSCGLPVIASRIPAHEEIIDHGVNGLLSESTTQGLAEAIQKVVSDVKLRKNLSKNARQRILTHFEKGRLNRLEITTLFQVIQDIKLN
jgi:glycosyltransferase involved in cell wall biosynthesis